MQYSKAKRKRLADVSALKKAEVARAIENALNELLGVELDDDSERLEIPVGSYEDFDTDERYREDYYMEHKIEPKYLKPFDFRTDKPIASR